MALPEQPPAGTTIAAFEDWASDVADTAADHEDRLTAVEVAADPAAVAAKAARDASNLTPTHKAEWASALSDEIATEPALTGTFATLDTDQTMDGIKSVPTLIVREHPTDIRHPDFGGVDLTGATVADAPIAAAIEHVLGTANPATATRTAQSPLSFPKGVFKVASPVTAQSALGFALQGAGKEQTVFKPVGTLASVIDLNGVSRSKVGGFSIAGDGTESITDAIICRHNGVNRTTNYSTLHDIAISSATRRVTGIRIGEDGDNTQNDSWKLDDLDIIGSWSSGESTWWQRGISLGGGTFGNNLDHKGYDLNVTSNAHNFHIDACQFALFGFETGQGEADFYVISLGSYLTAVGGRSEGSERLIRQISASSQPATAFFGDIDWKANGLHADGRFIMWQLGGHLGLRNIRAYGSPVPGSSPRIYTSSAGKQLDVTIDGLTTYSTLTELLTDIGADTHLHLRGGHSEVTAGGGIVTHTRGTIDVANTTTDIVARSRKKTDVYDRWQRQMDGTVLTGDGTAAPTSKDAPVGSLLAAARVSQMIVWDTFTKADAGPSTTALGTTDSGHSYTAVSNVSIVSNKVQPDATATVIRTVNPGVSNYDISADFETFSATANRFVLVVRHTSSNQSLELGLVPGSSLAVIRKIDGGSPTTLASAAFTVNANAIYRLRGTIRDNDLRLFIDDVLIVSHTLAGGDVATYASINPCGFRCQTAGANARIDNLIVRRF